MTKCVMMSHFTAGEDFSLLVCSQPTSKVKPDLTCAYKTSRRFQTQQPIFNILTGLTYSLLLNLTFTPTKPSL